MDKVVDGHTTFERNLRGVARIKPQVLCINRFNYAIAWKEQLQEGLSLYQSSHIEPNVDLGFEIFDNVKLNLYKLNYWKQNAPEAPTVISCEKDKLFIDLKGFPTEFRVSLSEDNMGEWTYYNIAGGIEILDDWQGKTINIQTRNTFGNSIISQCFLNS